MKVANIRFLAAALAALLGAAPAAAADKLGPISAADQQAIGDASARGSLIYAYDQAAWHGTDEMLAKLPDAGSKVGGWIVDGPANAPELIFVDRNEAAPHAVFFVDFRDGRLISSRAAGSADAELSPERKAADRGAQSGLVGPSRARLQPLLERRDEHGGVSPGRPR